jgi:hypothetical protein
MFLENHHRSVCPTKTLFLVFFEISRRESNTKRMIDVHNAPTTALYTKSEFRVFADKAITPFFSFEDIMSYETHGSIHDDGISAVSDNHTLLIKEVELIAHNLLKHRSSFCFIGLWTLYG